VESVGFLRDERPKLIIILLSTTAEQKIVPVLQAKDRFEKEREGEGEQRAAAVKGRGDNPQERKGKMSMHMAPRRCHLAGCLRRPCKVSWYSCSCFTKPKLGCAITRRDWTS
jgi:hypothetical protein